MAVVTLLPGYYVKILVDVNAKVLAVFSNVTIQMESEHAVDVFIVDNDGLNKFEKQQPTFPIYYNQDGISALTTSLKLSIPQGQMAWVVIQSKTQYPYTALYYNVT